MPTIPGSFLRALRRMIVWAAAYGSLIAAAFWFSYDLRFYDSRPGPSDPRLDLVISQRPDLLPFVMGLKLMLLWAFGQFRGILQYFRLSDAARLTLALMVSTAVLLALSMFSSEIDGSPRGIPRGVILIDFNLSLLLLAGFRILLRVGAERLKEKGGADTGTVERVAVVGAGSAGAQLVSELINRRGHGIRPVCFLDDDPAKHGLEIHGIPVVGDPDQLGLFRDRLNLTEVILALPSASIRRIREVTQTCGQLGLRTLVVPSLRELATGRVRASDIRPVSLEDLLGREPAQLDNAAIDAMVEGKVVLVTGAGGSIGSEIARQVASRRPSRLLVLDQCENLLYLVEQDLVELGFGALITPLVADVTDLPRMAAVFEKYKPGLVLHAAAHKHVPMMESQPGEAIKNNCLGSDIVARLASEHGADRFVLVSTDKAINPTNAMGASKRLAEIVVQAHQARPGNRTRFMAVRFGNVLGSSGSVIPLFRRQIATGGPITVTHPDVRRYFMTIPEAVGLVLQSASLGSGGEIYVLDMGEPLRIIDVARDLVRLSGLRPDIDIEIRITGLRPGEKLFEELRHVGEEFSPTPHPRIARFLAQPLAYEQLDNLLARVRELACADRDSCKLGIKVLVPEYTPYRE
jgi:FlaA1/EpsC-like NDP-sugar epimerase